VTKDSMKLGYVILYVPDVAATVDFYERAFGIDRRFVHESGQYAEMETGATALAFAAEDMAESTVPDFQRNRLGNPPAGAEISFVTADVAGRFARAVDSGATPVAPPMRKPWGQEVSYVRDRNGFLVEICSAIAG